MCAKVWRMCWAMRTAHQTTASRHWIGAHSGAKLVAMATSYYPDKDEADEERIRTSVRLPPAQQADIVLVAELWNELDKAMGRKRPRKWLAASVIERLIAVGLDGFWAQIGGRPQTQEGREELMRRAVEHLRQSPTAPGKRRK